MTSSRRHRQAGARPNSQGQSGDHSDQLNEPRTVNQTWARLKAWREEKDHNSPLSFSWFVLALDVLYGMGVVELRHDLLVARSAHAAPAER
ncbi:ABC-three component system middle component 6 [Kitasatospora sp. NPDC028055]|uniref:ABC-three component system middle component 6 n=1 Tax=Kitasatospora sp. NPDC028055 TaxID=3155653 RepID=UPI003400CAAC